MPAPFRPSAAPGMDPRLEPFLRTASQEGAGEALARLMADVDRLLGCCLQKYAAGRGSTGTLDLEEVASAARGSLIARLHRLRSGRAEQPPIGNLEAYVGAVARTAWAAEVRRRHPRRAALVNRLQYLLENRTGQRGFALWDGSDGRSWAGFDAWRGEHGIGGKLATDRRAVLATDPHTLTREIFGRGNDPAALHLAELVAGVFSWLGGPLPLRELIAAVAVWQGLVHTLEASGQEEGDPSGPCAVPDPGLSPHDGLCWQEYLRWLWDAATRLSLPQRTAFLLHSSCLRELELLGLTSVRQAAECLEVSPLLMAEYWNSIPLADRQIAALLRVDVQRVINLRRAARETLGRAWHGFLHEK